MSPPGQQNIQITPGTELNRPAVLHLADITKTATVAQKIFMAIRGMEWINLAQDGDRWRALVNAVMSLRVPENAGNSLSS